MRSTFFSILFLYLTPVYSQVLYPCKKHGDWGFRNVDGELIIECKYDSVTPFVNGISIVYEKNKRLTAIDKKGQHLFSKYPALSLQHFDFEYTTYHRLSGTVIINTKGEEFGKFRHVKILNNDWAVVGGYIGRDLFSLKRKSKITNQKYDYISPQKLDSSIVFITQTNELWGFIDENGNELVKAKYKYRNELQNIVPSKYKELRIFKPIEPYKVKFTKKGYKIVSAIDKNYALVVEGILYGVIDENDSLIIPCEWTFIERYGNIFLAEYCYTGKPYSAKYYDLEGVVHENCN